MTISTICVGGVAAGKWYSSEYDYLRVAATKSLSYAEVVKAPMAMEAATRIHSTTYRAMSLRYCKAPGDEMEFVFWVDAERIRDEYDLIRELANGYHPIGEHKL